MNCSAQIRFNEFVMDKELKKEKQWTGLQSNTNFQSVQAKFSSIDKESFEFLEKTFRQSDDLLVKTMPVPENARLSAAYVFKEIESGGRHLLTQESILSGGLWHLLVGLAKVGPKRMILSTALTTALPSYFAGFPGRAKIPASEPGNFNSFRDLALIYFDALMAIFEHTSRVWREQPSSEANLLEKLDGVYLKALYPGHFVFGLAFLNSTTFSAEDDKTQTDLILKLLRDSDSLKEFLYQLRDSL
jgi:hypothetical protein